MDKVPGLLGRKEEEDGSSCILWCRESRLFTVAVFQSGTPQMGVEYLVCSTILRERYPLLQVIKVVTKTQCIEIY
jgi:hypothetical protein